MLTHLSFPARWNKQLTFLCLTLFALLTLALTPANAQNRPLVVDLSEDEIAINVGFDGAELLMFGAIELPNPTEEFNLFVNIVGPKRSVQVRKKERVFGIWINRETATYEDIPGFYKSFTSRPVSDMVSEAEFKVIESGGYGLIGLASQGKAFDAALIRQMKAQGLFEARSDAISFLSNQLFRADISIPSNVPTGNYTVQVRLSQNGQQLHSSSTPLTVEKVGVGAQVYEFAQHQGLLYGIVAVLVALFMGYMSYAVFNRR